MLAGRTHVIEGRLEGLGRRGELGGSIGTEHHDRDQELVLPFLVRNSREIGAVGKAYYSAAMLIWRR